MLLTLCVCKLLMLIFFFFQAEDGIRDLYVTGIQTCALPIWEGEAPAEPRSVPARQEPRPPGRRSPRAASHVAVDVLVERSEERRVGKECNCRMLSELLTKNVITACSVSMMLFVHIYVQLIMR